jgi:tetratricopeptide (TPR) repeat protein
MGMPEQSVKLFLSCVSNEFGGYRNALGRALTRPNVEVKVQEDFKSLGGDTLSKLQEYIERCDAVVHFVGEVTGSAPAPISVDALLARHPDIKTRLPPLGAALEVRAPISYTQWEAWLALYFGKDLEVVMPAPRGKRARSPKASDASRAAQTEHLARLRAVGVHPNPPFTNQDNLIARIVNTSVIKALVKAVRSAQARQPRNLPFASLGSLFLGRDEALNELRTALEAGEGAAVVGRALHGLGGVGKTRLAIEYSLRCEADYSALLFVRADDPAALDANLAALAGAEVLDLPEKEAPQDAAKIEAVLGWLEAHPTWLMIVDNVDDGEAVKAVTKLMARVRGGHVIVTGRASNFPASLRKLELDVLDEDAATAFLLERTADDRTAEADDAMKARELAHELGGLALGLEQAGAYIATERIGFARYLELWRERRQKVLDWFDPALMGYDHDTGMAATWATSVDRLSPEGRRLLDRLAWLAPDLIPDSLLDVAVPLESLNLDAHEAVTGLYAYSLITRATGEDGLTKGFIMHRLVQDFARRTMSDARTGEAAAVAALWIAGAFVGDPQDVRSWRVLDPLASHALALARLFDHGGIADPTRQLFNRLGVLFIEKARFDDAEPLIRRALEIDEASYGPDHPDVASNLNNLAELLRQTNRHAEAEPLIRRALEIDEKNFGPDHPDVARDLNNLAHLLHTANRLAEMEPLSRRALEIWGKSFGPDHPRLAVGLGNLAEVLRQTNRHAEAEPVIRRALEIDEKNFGPDHPNVAARLNVLEGLMRDTNRYAEAEPLVRRALAIDEASYGPDHPKVAMHLNNLANLLGATNRVHEAEPLSRRALGIYETRLGRDHPRTVNVRKNLAVLAGSAQSGIRPQLARGRPGRELTAGPTRGDGAGDDAGALRGG